MANTLTLWCLVEGDEEPFSVDIIETSKVDKLKSEIYVKCQNTLPKINAKDLHLFKPHEGKAIELDSLRYSSTFQPHDFERLLTYESVSKYYITRNHDERLLHILVGLPGSSIRATSLSIPNKRARVDTRDKVLSARDYCIFLGWVEHNPPGWTSFYEHWMKMDLDYVFKQTVLNSYISRFDLPSPVETNGYILVLEQYKELFNRVMEIRREKSVSRGILLMGQPGVGKTTWLYFMLICLITKREPVAYYDGIIIQLFYHGRVYTTKEKDDAQFPQGTWCLIDCDSRLNADIPAFIVTKNRGAYPVQASSPNPTQYKAWVKQFCATILGMPLWSDEDIANGFRLRTEYAVLRDALDAALNPSPNETGVLMRSKGDALLHILEFAKEAPEGTDMESILKNWVLHLVQYYGKVPRLVYEAVLCGPTKFDSSIDSEVQRSGQEKLIAEIMAVANSVDLTSVDRKDHKVIGIVPKRMIPGSDTSDDYFLPTFLSDRVTERVKGRLGVLKHDLALKLFDRFKLHRESASFAGWIFESIAHQAVASVEKSKISGTLIPMTKTSNSKSPRPSFSTAPMAQETPQIVIPLRNRERVVVRVEKSLLMDVNDLEPLYCIPMTVNNPLFDSFIFELKESEGEVTPIIWVFQMSIGMVHGGSKRGYDYDLLKLVRERAELYGHERVREGWRVGKVELKYVLVIPATHKSGIWEMPTGWGAAVEGAVFCQKIDTSVLGSTEWW